MYPWMVSISLIYYLFVVINRIYIVILVPVRPEIKYTKKLIMSSINCTVSNQIK